MKECAIGETFRVSQAAQIMVEDMKHTRKQTGHGLSTSLYVSISSSIHHTKNAKLL